MSSLEKSSCRSSKKAGDDINRPRRFCSPTGILRWNSRGPMLAQATTSATLHSYCSLDIPVLLTEKTRSIWSTLWETTYITTLNVPRHTSIPAWGPRHLTSWRCWTELVQNRSPQRRKPLVEEPSSGMPFEDTHNFLVQLQSENVVYKFRWCFQLVWAGNIKMPTGKCWNLFISENSCNVIWKVSV